jgi:hypothetical protein
MKKLSGFDLGIIIAFVVVALLGGGAWWYLSGQLQTAQDNVKSIHDAFNSYSVSKGTGNDSIVVSPANGKVLQDNIDLLTAKLKPLIDSKLMPKDNKLRSIDKEDPVAWKHDLDDDVHQLTAAAKLHGISLPPNFYFGFNRYLNQSPNDEQTLVLSKQLLAIDQITRILLAGSVKGITSIRRTNEEEPHSNSGGSNFPESTESDHLGGYALVAPGNTYVDYPFEFDFETTSENLRTIMDGLVKSPYILVVRTLTIENTVPTSPQLSTLDQIAGAPSTPLIGTSPGEAAATPPSTKGPQYLFGHSTLKVKARIDLIEYTGGNIGSTP